MERRKFVKRSALGASLVLLGNISSAVASGPSEEITHYVLFWLKKELSAKEVKDFTGFFNKLKTIPEVKTLRYGRPAPTNTRNVVDNSFTYNLIVTFKNLKDIDVYETHPIHLEAIQSYGHLWDKVVVHDSQVG
ncbi:MAG: Dabb family protein [Pedobacter sp.]|nr:MAG: Dabb family protein [Pedobacter sp.]